MEISRSNSFIFSLSFFFIAATIWILTTPYLYLAILIAPAAIFLLFLINYPWLALFAILFMAPLDSYREMEIGFTLPKLFGLFLVGMVFFRLVLRLDYKALVFRSNLWLWMLAFLVINLLATLYAANPDTVIAENIKLLTAFCIPVFALFFIDSEKTSKWLAIVLILPISINALVSVLDYITGWDIADTKSTDISIRRSVGATSGPNTLCSWLIFSFPFLFHWFFNSQRFTTRLLIAGLFFIHVLTVMLTESRSGTLFTLLALAILFWKHRQHFRPIYLGLALCGTAFLTVGIVASAPKDYFARQESLFADTKDSSLERRFSYLLVAKDAFLESPIIGHGLGSFRDYFAKSGYARKFAYGSDIESQHKRYAHNTYLEIIVGCGLLGFIAFITIILLTIKNFSLASSYFRQQDHEETASLYDAYRLAFILLVIFFITLSHPYNKYMWLCMGVSEVARRISAERKQL